MVKGCCRKCVAIRTPWSELYEGAYFVVREGRGGETDSEMLTEAEKILESCLPRTKASRPKEKNLLPLVFFLSGLAAGLILMALLR